jgi:HEAT repeat protein
MKAVRPPEPEVIEEAEEALLSDEPLLGENDVVLKKPAPIDNDPALISEDSLYSDEDPLDVLSKKKKASQHAAAKVPPPAKPVSKVMPLSVKPGSGPKPAAKGSNARLVARRPEPEEPQEIEEVDAPEEISTDAEAPAETVPDVEDDDADVKAITVKKMAPAGSRGKSTQRLPASSSRGSRAARKDLEEADTRNSRRTTRRSTRSEAPKFAISKKQMIIAGVVVVLGLVLVIGWKPFWKSQHIKKLDSAEASVADKTAAAKALFEDYHTDAFELFRTRLTAGDPGTREAAIGGVELFAKHRQEGIRPFEKCAESFSSADAPGKVLLIKSTQAAIKALDGNSTPEQAKEDFEKKKIAATMLISGSHVEAPADVRSASIEALGSLRVPGVCKQLLSIAMTEKGDLRNKARAGVDYTALPDVAPDLLQIMIGTDEEMKKMAQEVFKNVQKGAKSAALLPHVKNPSPEVREKIVAALGERKSDPVAAEAMAIALADEVVKIRLLAVKSIPATGVTKASVLAVPMNDADESVRVATAQTLGTLRSLDCKRVVLEAFQNNPTGATMQALTAALAECSSGKDIEAVGIILPFMKKTPPDGQTAMCEALVRLTLNKAERKAWNGAQWEKWYAHISKREQMKKDALSSLEDAKKGKDIKNSANFPALMKQTDDALAILEECEKMCDTFNDREDIPGYEKLRKDYSDMRYHFQKFQTLKH